MSRAANRGYAPAQADLALWCYEGGLGFAQDLPQARRWAQAAGDQKHPKGNWLLAKMCRLGQAVPIDYAEAKSRLDAAVAANDAYAIFLQGEWLWDGLVYGKTQDGAMRQFVLAARMDPHCALMLAQRYEKKLAKRNSDSHKNDALNWYQNAARRGSLPARQKLAQLLLEGHLSIEKEHTLSVPFDGRLWESEWTTGRYVRDATLLKEIGADPKYVRPLVERYLAEVAPDVVDWYKRAAKLGHPWASECAAGRTSKLGIPIRSETCGPRSCWSR